MQDVESGHETFTWAQFFQIETFTFMQAILRVLVIIAVYAGDPL
jgi:hypothetical protein